MLAKFLLLAAAAVQGLKVKPQLEVFPENSFDLTAQKVRLMFAKNKLVKDHETKMKKLFFGEHVDVGFIGNSVQKLMETYTTDLRELYLPSIPGGHTKRTERIAFEKKYSVMFRSETMEIKKLFMFAAKRSIDFFNWLYDEADENQYEEKCREFIVFVFEQRKKTIDLCLDVIEKRFQIAAEQQSIKEMKENKSGTSKRKREEDLVERDETGAAETNGEPVDIDELLRENRERSRERKRQKRAEARNGRTVFGGFSGFLKFLLFRGF